VEDPDGDNAFRYRLVKGPSGMTIGFDDGQIKWEPPADAAGTHEVEVEVADLFGGKSTYRFSLELSYETVKSAPAASTQPSSGATGATATNGATAASAPAARRRGPQYGRSTSAEPAGERESATTREPGEAREPTPGPASHESF
jgi:hypothetical protein